MATISLQVAPANSHRTFTNRTISKDPRHHDGNVHEALHEIYVLAKQDMEQMSAEPPQKKRRLNDDIVLDEDYIVLAKAILELTSKTGEKLSGISPGPSVPITITTSQYAPKDTDNELQILLGAGSKRTHRRIAMSLDAATTAPRNAWKYIRCASVDSTTNLSRTTSVLVPPSLIRDTWSLEIEVRWRKGQSAVLTLKTQYRGPCERILELCMPRPAAPSMTQRSWSPQEFYQHVHVPSVSTNPSNTLPIPTLTCELYPFQQRAVRWLAQREGITIDSEGRTSPFVEVANPLPISFRLVSTDIGEELAVSNLLTEVSSLSEAAANITQFRGGILAEEMGLGKTVELISLISLHRRTQAPIQFVDDYTGTEVTSCNATLIITPPTILEQWKSEIARHAPDLKVFHYTGLKGEDKDVEIIQRHFMEHDIVLTTYTVLAAEIHYAQEAPKRNLRREKVYVQRRSPLVSLSWWRVCLDEAQMIESGVSNAATVACLIPRVNAWCVSGTPVRKDVKDLHGLLIFLRYHPFSDARVWQRMLTGDPAHLIQLFGQIAMRHSKNAVRDEMGIPPQKRIVVTVPFTAIEESNYNHLFQQMCDDTGLSIDGSPLKDDWDPNSASTVEKMRSWLTRLRQTCLHAEIGVRNRKALGRGNGPLRTVDEVLEVLIEQNETSLRGMERSMLLARVLRGHLLSFGKQPQQALDLYNTALEEATEIVAECREQVHAEQQKVQLKTFQDTGTKKETDSAAETDVDDDHDEGRAKLRQYQQRLRSALELQHICTFFCGTAYFQLKDKLGEPEEEAKSEAFLELEKKESSSYDSAKRIRKELLTDVGKKTQSFLDKLAGLKKKSFINLPRIEDDIELEGIESQKVTDKIATLYDLLNEQSMKIKDWRNKLSDLLLLRLVDQDEDVEMTGEEYESSTKQQDEQYFYHEALRAGLADMHSLVTGQLNQLIDVEMRAAYKFANNGAPEEPENKGPAPELFIKMLDERTTFIQRYRKLPRLQKGGVVGEPPFISARGIMSEIRSLITAVQWQQGVRSNRAEAEVIILERHLEKLQAVSTAQSKALARVEEELDLFRSTMNQRLEFYRQLQQISDQVAPLQEEAAEEVDWQRFAFEEANENQHAEKLAALKTKRRFLSHLKAESSGKQEQRICIICQGSFETGVLTVCGHQYCKECIQIWWKQKQTCPMCKRHLKSNEFHQITYKPQELRAQEEVQTSGPSQISSAAQQQQSSIYTSISTSTLDAIKSTDLPSNASYGTKIDLICRTLLHLRSQDPGSKSIIFSQYRDFLQVLSAAFSAHRIGFSAISDKNGISRFREDASVECFLLHAKADSSGLNLVNATHVFLCEPLINAAIELQAVARVHRIGQKRETTVWMFLVHDTVEEAIYDISVRRRLAHIQRSVKEVEDGNDAITTSTTMFEEKSLDAANSLELQAAPLSKLLTKGQSGGEVVDKEDLWTCLFKKKKMKKADYAVADENVGGVMGEEISRFLRADAAAQRAEAA